MIYLLSFLVSASITTQQIPYSLFYIISLGSGYCCSWRFLYPIAPKANRRWNLLWTICGVHLRPRFDDFVDWRIRNWSTANNFFTFSIITWVALIDDFSFLFNTRMFLLSRWVCFVTLSLSRWCLRGDDWVVTAAMFSATPNSVNEHEISSDPVTIIALATTAPLLGSVVTEEQTVHVNAVERQHVVNRDLILFVGRNRVLWTHWWKQLCTGKTINQEVSK